MKPLTRWMAGGILAVCASPAWAQLPPPPPPSPNQAPAYSQPPAYSPARRPLPRPPAAAPDPAPQVGPPPGSYFEFRDFDDFQRPRRMQDYSFVYMEAPPPRELREHDIITIVVNEKSSTTMNSIFNRQKNATYKAQLKEFVRLGKTGNLETAAENQPTIDSNLQGRIQASGQLNDTEGITFRIAAEVVNVLPNGLLVLEARETVRSNREVWEYTLTGKVSSRDVARDYTAQSEKIANLEIRKTLKGKVYESTNRPWGTRLWDRLFPF